MSLVIEIGDLLTSTLNKDVVICHGVNAQGVMGSGFAKQVKELYPHAYLAYKQAHRRYGLKVGQVVVSPQHNDGPIVANCCTQELYRRTGGQFASYDGIIVALQQVVKQFPSKEIHLPLIGGGLGGLDKKRLVAIFQAVFVDSDATLWLTED